MMPENIAGTMLLIVAGISSGIFALPMKFARRWAWENIWLAWTLMALVLLPMAVTFLTIPQIAQVYRAAGPGVIGAILASGLFWGVTQVLFGLTVDALGIALAFAIVPGISAALGSLIPLV